MRVDGPSHPIRIFWAILWLLSALPAAATTLVLEDDHDRADVDRGVRVILDPEGALELADVLDADGWRPVPQKIPRFGYTEAAVWLHFRAVNGSGPKARVFCLDNSVIDRLEIHQLQDGRIVRSLALGDRLPFRERVLQVADFAVPLELPLGQVQDFYVRLAGTSSLQAPISFWTEHAFSARTSSRYFWNGMLVGVTLAIVLYGLIALFVLREADYLAFSGYTLSFLLVPIVLQGFGYQFLWPTSPWLQERSPLLLLPLLVATALVFTCRFLGLPQRHPRLAKGLRVASGIMVLALAPLAFVDYRTAIRGMMLASLAAEAVVFGVGVFVWRRHGDVTAKVFSLAWLPFLFGSLFIMGNRFGLLQQSRLMELGPMASVAIQALVMSLALTCKFRDSKQAQARAEHELVEYRRQAEQELKVEVQRRTAELQQVMRQLARVNMEFEEENRLDGLTGVFNRKSFDERLETEFRRAGRTRTEISVLMVDIDHFKRFNDDYGHQTGDQCLIRVAKTIEETARRTDDFTARYGGEEFAVILIGTKPDSARMVAERVRKAVEDLEFEVEGARVPITVSVGLHTVKPGPDDTATDLVAASDAALYRAKADGRNRVAGPAPEPALP